MRSTIALTFLVIVATLLFLLSLETGPNCPNSDPDWLGFCINAPLSV